MIRKALFFNGKKGFCPPQMGEPGGGERPLRVGFRKDIPISLRVIEAVIYSQNWLPRSIPQKYLKISKENELFTHKLLNSI